MRTKHFLGIVKLIEGKCLNLYVYGIHIWIVVGEERREIIGTYGFFAGNRTLPDHEVQRAIGVFERPSDEALVERDKETQRL